MTHTGTLWSKINKAFDNKYVDMTQRVNATTRNLSNYDENINIKLVDKKIDINHAGLMNRVSISNGLTMDMLSKVFVEDSDNGSLIIFNNFYNNLPIAKEFLATLCQVSNNIIRASNNALVGEYLLNDGKVVHCFEFDSERDVILMPDDEIIVSFAKIMHIVLKSSAILAGLIKVDDIAYSLKYEFSIAKEDYISIHELLQQ